MISFETKDGKIIRAELDLMNRSSVIRAMCSACPEQNQEDVVIPLHGIASGPLLKILLWAQFHKDDVEPEWVNKSYPIPVLEIEGQTSYWDKEFLRESLSHICELLEGANYLEINWLLKLCLQKLFFNEGRLTSYQCEKYLKNMHAIYEFDVVDVSPEEDYSHVDWELYLNQIYKYSL